MVLGEEVQIGLKTFLPLCDEFSVHVPNQLLGGKGQVEAGDLTQEDRQRTSEWVGQKSRESRGEEKNTK